MKRIIVAVLLAGLAGTIGAAESTIGIDERCPSGTFELVRAYSLDRALDGHLVQTGKVCKDLTSGN